MNHTHYHFVKFANSITLPVMIADYVKSVMSVRRKGTRVSKISDLKYETWFTDSYAVLTKEESALCLARWVKEGCKL